MSVLRMHAQARQLLQEALRADAGSSKALCLLGCVEGGLRNHAAARAHFGAGAEADPANAVLLGAWARMEAGAGDLPRAEQLFGAALALNPDNIVLLQVCLFSLLPRLSLTRLHQYAMLVPFAHGCTCMHAWPLACNKLLHSLQDRWPVGRVSESALWWAPQEWAVAQARVKNFKAARALFIRALALNPRHVPALAAWADAERSAGAVQAARNLYARALQVCKERVPLRLPMLKVI